MNLYIAPLYLTIFFIDLDRPSPQRIWSWLFSCEGYGTLIILMAKLFHASLYLSPWVVYPTLTRDMAYDFLWPKEQQQTGGKHNLKQHAEENQVI